MADLSFDIAGVVDVWGEGGRERALSQLLSEASCLMAHKHCP